MKQKYGVLGIVICMLGLMGCTDKEPTSIVAANNDTVTMGVEDVSLNINVLENDIYPVADDVYQYRLKIDTLAEHGKVEVITSHENIFFKYLIKYTVTEEAFAGRDTFRYCTQLFYIGTEKLFASDCASVNVLVGNSEPVVNAGEDKTMLIGTPLRIEGSATDDRDAPDTLTFEWKEGADVLGDSAVLMYDPELMGQHKLVLTATDTEGASASDEVNITVNGFNTVDAHDDDVSVVAPNSTDIDVLANDDLSGEVSTVELEIDSSPDGGTVQTNVVDGKKVISYDPGDFVGTETFVYSATIGGVSDKATVTVHVTSDENHAPTVANGEMTVNCELGAESNMTLEGDDVDGDTLTFSIDPTNISFGVVDFNRTTGVITISIDGSQDNGECLEGTPSSFTYQAKDDDELDSNVGTITINPT